MHYTLPNQGGCVLGLVQQACLIDLAKKHGVDFQIAPQLRPLAVAVAVIGGLEVHDVTQYSFQQLHSSTSHSTTTAHDVKHTSGVHSGPLIAADVLTARLHSSYRMRSPDGYENSSSNVSV